MSKKIQITLPDKTYALLEKQAKEVKVRLTTWVAAVVRKAVENGK